MDAIELLINDHNEVKALFQRYRSAQERGDEGTTAEVVRQIMRELHQHTTIEEEIFYPAVREADDELNDEVAEGLQEHHVVDVLMNEMRDLDAGSEEWVAKMQVLMENVEHHVEEEEEDLFPDVREAMDQSKLDELGQQMAERKESGQSEPQSRDELHERAKELEIDGRSDMSRDELAEAVSAAEA